MIVFCLFLCGTLFVRTIASGFQFAVVSFSCNLSNMTHSRPAEDENGLFLIPFGTVTHFEPEVSQCLERSSCDLSARCFPSLSL